MHIKNNDTNYCSTSRMLRSLRDSLNPFDVPVLDLKKKFRMPQEKALKFIGLLEVHDFQHNSTIPFFLQVLATLNFYATGSYQNSVGQNNSLNISQPSVSRFITYISKLIVLHLGSKYIKFPQNTVEMEVTASEFHEKFGISNTVGCVDCVHIAIISPPQNDPLRPPRLYRNRKRYYSINVEAVFLHVLYILTFMHVI